MANYPGTNGNNFIFGAIGNDVLNSNWSLGDDSMYGGAGNDVYNVNSVGDNVFESIGNGIDTVVSRNNNYTIGNNIENLTLDNTFEFNAAFNGTGNSLNNTIIGNNNHNILAGLDGNDTLNGDGGNDTLNGGNGADTLIGGTGADTMDGGDQNDTYSVDDTGDIVKENFNDAIGGVDTVYSTASYSINGNLFGQTGYGIENLTLTGTAYSAVGNDNNNILLGTSSNNYLSGGNGNDTLIGAGGNDSLYGGSGNDTLNGGIGYDTFNFINSNATGGVDTITGFDATFDTIGLDAQAGEAFSQGLAFSGGVGSTLNINWYFEGAGFNGNGANSSGIYFDTATGNLWYNPTSGWVNIKDSYHFATIDLATVIGGAASLSAADFVLI